MMPSYAYRAYTEKGQRREGRIEAEGTSAAEQALSKAVEVDPGRPDVHLARAWALEGLRKPHEALAEYQKVLAIDPARDDALFGRALALRADGDLAGASAAFRQYLNRKPSVHAREAQEQLAAIALRLQRAEAAKAAPAAAELAIPW